MQEVKVASDLLVGDPALLEKKIEAIRLGGPQKLQVSACIWFIINLSVFIEYFENTYCSSLVTWYTGTIEKMFFSFSDLPGTMCFCFYDCFDKFMVPGDC